MSQNIYELIGRYSEELEEKAIGLRRELHAHPEMSGREYNTAKKVAAYLRDIGVDQVFDCQAGGTGVLGVINGGLEGPIVGIRADMDAQAILEETGLPFASRETCEWGTSGIVPVMHCCGHDVHTAMMMAAAEVLVKVKDKINGKVLLVFQPSEEGPAPGWEGNYGAALYLEEEIFNQYRPEAMFCMHIDPKQPIGSAGEIGYFEGATCMAVTGFSIKFTGVSGHGSKPWLGVDTLLPAAQTLLGLQCITTRNVDPSANQVVMTCGQLYGGTKFNVIADEAYITGACRFTDYSKREMLERRIIEVAEHNAIAGGATAEVTMDFHQPPNINDKVLIEKMTPRFQKGMGTGKVIVNSDRSFKFPDDFAHFSLQIPSIYASISVAPDEGDPDEVPGLHTANLMVNEKAILSGIKAFATFAATYGHER